MISIYKLKRLDIKKIIEWNNGKSESFLYQWAGKNTYRYPITEEQIIERMFNKEITIFRIENNEEMVGTVEIGVRINKSDSKWNT